MNLRDDIELTILQEYGCIELAEIAGAEIDACVTMIGDLIGIDMHAIDTAIETIGLDQ